MKHQSHENVNRGYRGMDQIDLATRWKGPLSFGIVLCAIFLVAACTPDQDRPLGKRQSAARGEAVFDQNCGYCHGAEARGPALSELKSLAENERRKAVFNHPVSGEIPQRLSSHDLSDLMEFLESREDPSDQ
jgi:mono/diheme cytochrome c family protein